MKITIVDYGLGNILSIQNAVKFLGHDTILTRDPDVIRNANKLILPGVGSFPFAMREIKKNGVDEAILDYCASGKDALGICIGMQVLFDKGFEFSETRGLGVIEGEVSPIDDIDSQGFKRAVPRIGWFRVKETVNHKIFSSTGEEYFYFVHSFQALPKNSNNLIAVSKYGADDIVAAVCKENVIGLQFHPERSGKVGLKVIENFCEM